jgi:hypothetical protein
MGSNSVKPGTPGGTGQTDKDRGSMFKFAFTKAGRKTGRIGTMTKTPNSNTEDGNERSTSDPRLA